MRLPVITGTIKRRLLVNFRADPGATRALLPRPFRPKLHHGRAIVGICLIRMENERPLGMPGFVGIASENAAHRIAVEWDEPVGTREGVYIPRRDTDSAFNRLAGGRLFPGHHHAASFQVVDERGHIELSVRSADGDAEIDVVGNEAPALPAGSLFASLAEASRFFEAGSFGYSPTRDSDRLDGLELRTQGWQVGALDVTHVHSSYFENVFQFPPGTIEFDHALIMRDIVHEWRVAEAPARNVATVRSAFAPG